MSELVVDPDDQAIAAGLLEPSAAPVASPNKDQALAI